MTHIEAKDGKGAIQKALDALHGMRAVLTFKNKKRGEASGVVSHDQGGNAWFKTEDKPPRLVTPREIESIDF